MTTSPTSHASSTTCAAVGDGRRADDRLGHTCRAAVSALQRALEKMREVFRIRELRPGQAEIIESVLAGRDTLAIMPTGSGKSLTYQLPALVMDGPDAGGFAAAGADRGSVHAS